MFNFTYHNPTTIVFGKNTIAELPNYIPAQQRVLITYGGGSIKKNGVLDQVRKALVGYTVFEFGGIEPNPTYETLIKAVALVKKEKIDFILAVGGGSVIDGTKFIAAAVQFEGEPWDILAKYAPITKALPFGTVLTLPATGSEMNSGAVITRKEFQAKLVFMSPLVYPQFSILDPLTTYSLPAKQISNGIIDTFIHTTEQYLTFPVQAKIQDRFAEGILLTLIEEGPKALRDPKNYDVRANIMWSATLGLNGLIGQGVPQDWATHMIGHEITALHGLDHAETLAIIWPSLMTIQKEKKKEKLLQYAERIWGLTAGDAETKISTAIAKTRSFFESLQVKTYLNDYGITAESISKIVKQLNAHGMSELGEHGDVTPVVAEKILLAALHS